jgi:hypothetical protein
MSSHDAKAAPLPAAPISMQEFELLKKTALFGDDDVRCLRMSADILAGQTDAILDVWYGFVGANPHLLHYFTDPDTGKPVDAYLSGVRERFARWIHDTAAAQYDEHWLAYQFEIGRRHHRGGKNRTDGVRAVDHIHFRYIPALGIPITTTLKPFLAKNGHSAEDVEAMHAAWVKSVTLQVILWSWPYIRDGDF